MNCLYFNTELLYRGRNSPVRCRESAVIHRIAHSLLRGLSALALSGCIVFMGEIAVSWSLDAALERSADRATRGAVRVTPAPFGKSASGL